MITSADALARHNGHMPAIPDSTRSSITLRLLDHAEKHWPQMERVQVRYRGRSPMSPAFCAAARPSPYATCATAAPRHSFGFAIYKTRRIVTVYREGSYRPSRCARRWGVGR